MANGILITQSLVLLVTSRNPDPGTPTPPPGGGIIPGSTNPATGVNLCGAEVPVAFLDLTPPGGTTRRYSAVPINMNVQDDPRVQSFGAVTRSLTNRQGDWRGATASPVLSDTDRFLRGLEETDGLVNARLEYFLSTEAAIKAGSTPNRRFSGTVTHSEPLPGLLMRLQASGYLQAWLELNPSPDRTFTTTDFPNLANNPKSLSSPGNPALIGKPVPICYGPLSDESLGLAAKGVVPAFFTGKRTVNGFDWDEYVIACHAPSPGGVLGLFGDNGGGIRSRIDLPSQEGIDVICPGHAGWNAHVGSSNLYRDFNGRRYFVMYGRGPRSDSAREGRIPFSVNMGGVEDVGDGTGDTIDEIPIQVIHLLNNWYLQTYQSGSWLAYPTVASYDRFNSSTFVTAAARNDARVAGGYIGAFVLGWDGEPVTFSEIGSLAYRHGLYLGENKDGQIIGSAIDPTDTAVRSVSDITDRLIQTLKLARRRDEIRNSVTYRYARRYVPALPEPTPVTGDPLPAELSVPEPDWETDVTTPVVDSGSVAKYGTRGLSLDLEWTRDMATADDIAALHLEVLAPGPMVVEYTEGLCGTNVELGDNVELTDGEGVAAAGWVNQPLRYESQTDNLDEFTSGCEALDLSTLP